MMRDIVGEAERAISNIKNNDRRISTSQIRVLLAAVNALTNKVEVWLSKDGEAASGDKLSDELQAAVKYLKVKVAYQAGRERAVKEFEEEAKLLSKIDDVGDSVKKYLEFAHYMEALVAYHKFYDINSR